MWTNEQYLPVRTAPLASGGKKRFRDADRKKERSFSEERGLTFVEMVVCLTEPEPPLDSGNLPKRQRTVEVVKDLPVGLVIDQAKGSKDDLPLKVVDCLLNLSPVRYDEDGTKVPIDKRDDLCRPHIFVEVELIELLEDITRDAERNVVSRVDRTTAEWRFWKNLGYEDLEAKPAN